MGETRLEVPCDLLVPAAMSYVITADAAVRIEARIVVEGANLPTPPEAEPEAVLMARGITVVPDFLANVMTNAWWWVVFADIEPTAAASFAKIDEVMGRLVDTVMTEAQRSGATLRQWAQGLATANMVALTERVGVTA